MYVCLANITFDIGVDELKSEIRLLNNIPNTENA